MESIEDGNGEEEVRHS